MSGTASGTMTPGRALELGSAVLQQLPRDITPEQALVWINDQAGLQAALRAALIPTNGTVAVTVAAPATTFALTVNYDLAHKAKVKAGRFDYVNDNITEKNFSRSKKRGKEEVLIELEKYDRAMESDEVLAAMEAKGLRAATFDEACAFGAAHPDVQRQFPVVFLGSPWVRPDGDRRVPFLSWDGTERDLHLHWWDRGWLTHYRFAAVRK